MPVYSIKTIKEYANNYISNNGREITKTVLLITSAVIFVQAVNFFSQVLGLILGLITLTMPQGLVYASLKIVEIIRKFTNFSIIIGHCCQFFDFLELLTQTS